MSLTIDQEEFRKLLKLNQDDIELAYKLLCPSQSNISNVK